MIRCLVQFVAQGFQQPCGKVGQLARGAPSLGPIDYVRFRPQALQPRQIEYGHWHSGCAQLGQHCVAVLPAGVIVVRQDDGSVPGQGSSVPRAEFASPTRVRGCMQAPCPQQIGVLLTLGHVDGAAGRCSEQLGQPVKRQLGASEAG